MTHALPLRIFLATPGDLTDERATVLAAVAEHNRRRGRLAGVEFEVVGWEQVRGTARRPQEAINELISECHYMIVLFKERWGSTPGSPWGYTSGTEEELFTGLLELGQSDQPMRDVWVTFMRHAMPDDRVTSLRDQMKREHAMLFETVADVRELKTMLTERLEGWESATGPKQARHVDLVSSAGNEVLRAAKLRIAGEKLVELGQHETGKATLHEAAAIGGPVENLAYARLLARQGDYPTAIESIQTAIDQCVRGGSPLFSALTAEAFAAQAGVLRRQGDKRGAIGRLEAALTLLVDDDLYSQRARCRILDDLGIAHQGLGGVEKAESVFEEALTIRRNIGNESDIAQSLVNLGRVAVASRSLPLALQRADEATRLLSSVAPSELHSNAAALCAQVHLRMGNPSLGIPYAEQALALNRQFASTRGEAIALLLLAQCHRALGADAVALTYAQECLELNQAMDNTGGVERAQWLIRELVPA